MKIKNKKIICIVSTIYLSNMALSETYQYHSSASIELGAPYDVFSPGESLVANGMFEWTENGYTQEEGVSNIHFDYSEINSTSDLSKALSIDANAEASFTFGSGSVSVEYSKLSESSKNELVIAVTAYREYKPRKKKGVLKLTAQGKEYLKQAIDVNKLYYWRKIAGSDVIIETVRGHSLTLFYRFSSANRKNIEKLRTEVASTWSSGSASADIVKTAKSIDSTVSVKVDYKQSGGASDITVLSSLLEGNVGDVKKVKIALAEALKKGTSENARILRFKTLSVKNMGEVVFSTDGKYQEIVDHQNEILKARKTHFNRLMLAKRRLNLVQRLLDEKPNKSYVLGGKKKLDALKKQLKGTIVEIQKEYAEYQNLNPQKAKVTTERGSNIPFVTSVNYFAPPFVKPSLWVRTNGSAARGGWSTYKDAEFHDFYVQFYPKLDFILPEFIQRIRIFRGTTPVSSLGREEILKSIKEGGSIAKYYQSKHQSIKVYTWGLNHMPQKFNNWKDAKRKEEGNAIYTLEVVTTDETVHYVSLGNIMKSGGQVVDPKKLGIVKK